MMSTRVVFRASVLLLALASCRYASGQNHRSALKYSRDSSARDKPVILVAPSGANYKLRLIPENDVGHHVVVLSLALNKPDSQTPRLNLLEPPGRWHGYQPYIFAASDFVQSVNGPLDQHVRTIDLPKLDMQIEVTIVGVKVEPTPPSATSREIPYEFLDLSLEISTKRLSRQGSGKQLPK
jgi:hypothetical protein